MHFPAKGKPKPKDTFEAQRAGYSADVIAKWVSDRTGINVKIVVPPDYNKLITNNKKLLTSSHRWIVTKRAGMILSN